MVYFSVVLKTFLDKIFKSGVAPIFSIVYELGMWLNYKKLYKQQVSYVM